MLTYGFYNSLNHDRKYTATQLSSIFDGVIKDGIFMSIGDCFKVTADGTDMTALVGTGRAWFNHTWTLNDAPIPIRIPTSEVILNRIDAVVLEVNESTRENAIKVISGTPGTSPKKPALTNTTLIHQYALAYITVNSGVTEIRQANIESRIGQADTPYVTGILETVDIESMVAQWKDQWDAFTSDYEKEVNDWFEALQDTLDGDVAVNLQKNITEVSDELQRHISDADTRFSDVSNAASTAQSTANSAQTTANSAVKRGGDTMTGSLTIAPTSSTASGNVFFEQGGRRASVKMGTNGYFGLYDETYQKWILGAPASGTGNTFNGTASGNLPLTGGSMSGYIDFGSGTSMATMVGPRWQGPGGGAMVHMNESGQLNFRMTDSSGANTGIAFSLRPMDQQSTFGADVRAITTNRDTSGLRNIEVRTTSVTGTMQSTNRIIGVRK